MNVIQDNGLILIVYKDRKYLKRVSVGQSFHGKGGALNYADVIGREFGNTFGDYEIYEPTMEDIIMYAFKRETQVIYPKDSFYIASRINAKSGSKVLEVGTGSGALTYVLAHTVGPQGRVITFEVEERHFKNAKKNIEKFGEWDNVEMHNEEILDYSENDFDAAFIDTREPWLCLDAVRARMKPSASVGMIVPTANQISELLKALETGFGQVEVMEIMHRKYKTVAERVRPQDRMIAHTGYLVFARKLEQKMGIDNSTPDI